jgi:hypothetical protein
MKRFLACFSPAAILSGVIWFLLVGSGIDAGYADCKAYGMHDPALCAEYHDIMVGEGYAILFTIIAFLSASAFYFVERLGTSKIKPNQKLSQAND